MQSAPIDAVRARIAQLILGQTDTQRICMGSIELRPHQRSAVLRLRESLREFGGAVLCDPVGTGKTFVALALPAVNARLLVVAPAVLRDMWFNALAVTRRSGDFVSFESLSRGSHPHRDYDFVIVDEAHHARNPKTVRYGMLARLVSHCDVVLMSATPIHNRRADLVTLISLFLGERAGSLKSSELARCVIRRDAIRNSLDGMPKADELTWVNLPENNRIPELLLSLPPPLSPRDGGDAGVLIARSLIRQWASSNAALIGGLKRRIVRAQALIAALSDNTWPTRQELLSWVSGDDSVQLGLPGILAAGTSNTTALLEIVREHLKGVQHVLESLHDSRADSQRAALIREIRLIHRDRSVVAFSEYADTINGLFRLLVRDGSVCALTASEACVAGGQISRMDAIAQFAPIANGHRPPPEANAITLLLTTDLLSEGINLQDAGVVIHLDLPWTPARIEQRLGRVARVGSRHESVLSYAFRPPMSAETVVRIERILRDKLQAAGIVVQPMPFFPGAYSEPEVPTAPQRNEAIRLLLSKWVRLDSDNRKVVAGVSADRNGFIAVAEVGGTIRTIVKSGDVVAESAGAVLEILQQSCGAAVELSPSEAESCEREALAWLAADLALPCSTVKQSIRAAVAKRINRMLRDARTHDRARLARKAERVFAAIDSNLGAHDEIQLKRICDHFANEERLLDEVILLAGERGRPATVTPGILAMIVLVAK